MTNDSIKKFLGKKVKVQIKAGSNNYVVSGTLSYDMIFKRYRLVNVGESIILLKVSQIQFIELII